MHNNGEASICMVCEMTFEDAASLGWHLVQNHYDGKKFPCSLCEAVFAVEDSLVAHKSNTHKHKNQTVQVEPFSCGACSLNFTSEKLLSNHRRFCDSVKEWLCMPCSLTFTSQSLLTQHRKDVHTVKDESGVHYICGNCGKRHKTAENCDRHWMVCTGKKKLCLSFVP